MATSSERDLIKEKQMKRTASKVGVLWGVLSEAKGWPTGNGSAELEVEVVKYGPGVG